MLDRNRTALVVVDVQERLLPFIHESETLVGQIALLISGCRALDIPILVTEQYRKGIGPTAERIVESLTRPASDFFPAAGSEGTAASAAGQSAASNRPDASGHFPAEHGRPADADRFFQPIEKMTFSCAAHEPFMEALRHLGRRQALLCGIESHVCVLQTALQLQSGGFEVFLAADAVSSRNPRNIEIALRRMEQAGVQLTSVEMAVFEMLHVCGTGEFKAWSRMIR
jgi:nicotinamidase-related amidase